MSAFNGLGKALRWIRDKQDKKQYQVADTAGVTKAMLSAYETGKQKPSIETLEKILNALQVDLADLFNAIQVINERPPLPRYKDYQGLSPLGDGEGPAPGQVDVYQLLGIERPLHPAQEEAITEMLRGFHRLVRFFHDTMTVAEQEATPRSRKGEVEPPQSPPSNDP